MTRGNHFLGEKRCVPEQGCAEHSSWRRWPRRAAAAADLNRQINFNIPRQPLAQALADFSRQSDVIVVASSEVTSGKTSTPINAITTPAGALKQLLEGTKLQYTQEKDGSVIVKQPMRISMLLDSSGSNAQEDTFSPAQGRVRIVSGHPGTRKSKTQLDRQRELSWKKSL